MAGAGRLRCCWPLLPLCAVASVVQLVCRLTALVPAGSVHLSDGQSEDGDPGEGLLKTPVIKPKKGRRTSVEAMPDLDTDDEDVTPATPTAELASAPAASASAATIEPTSSKTLGLELADLEHIGTLGVGTFSRVKMVKIRGSDETYALKIMKKKVIEIRKQKEHVMNEKHIMAEMNGNPFLLTLKTTFKDEVYLYMLLELCQGGELFSRLLEETTLSEDTTRFYCGCIVLALEALHGKDNIYRDLKPENILLDALGYVKIGDFGFAKKVKERTFTRCGTPEYVSPEMLGRSGHNKATDYWSLGIFVYECLHGTTPFAATNYLSTYKKIAAYSKQGKPNLQPTTCNLRSPGSALPVFDVVVLPIFVHTIIGLTRDRRVFRQDEVAHTAHAGGPVADAGPAHGQAGQAAGRDRCRHHPAEGARVVQHPGLEGALRPQDHGAVRARDQELDRSTRTTAPLAHFHCLSLTSCRPFRTTGRAPASTAVSDSSMLTPPPGCCVHRPE